MSSTKYSNAKIVDCDTGAEITKLHPGDAILRGESFEHLLSTVRWNPSNSFKKIYDEASDELRKLSSAEAKMFFFMYPKIRYQSGLLAYDNGKPLNVENIADALDMEERAVNYALNGLYKERVIGFWTFNDEVKIYMNPYIVSVGTVINKSLQTMFEDSKWARLYRKAERKKRGRVPCTVDRVWG